jgi:predicted component of type VI protein secretion system
VEGFRFYPWNRPLSTVEDEKSGAAEHSISFPNFDWRNLVAHHLSNFLNSSSMLSTDRENDQTNIAS